MDTEIDSRYGYGFKPPVESNNRIYHVCVYIYVFLVLNNIFCFALSGSIMGVEGLTISRASQVVGGNQTRAFQFAIFFGMISMALARKYVKNA